MSRQPQPRVLIVGAGLGGLTAALALLKKGCDIALFERSPMLSEAGAGLHCSPNGTRVLYALGLEQPLSRVAVNLQARDVRLWSTGQAWDLPGHGASAVQRYGAPYLLLHRGDLHGILAAAVDAEHGEAHLDARCIGFTQDADGVHLDFADGRTASGDLLIGADGIHSTIRKQLFGPDKPIFTGDIAWRGLVPVERLPSYLTRADRRVVEEIYEPEARLQQLERIKLDFTRMKVIADYILSMNSSPSLLWHISFQ